LNTANLSPRNYLWNAGLALAPFMAVTAVIAWTFLRYPDFSTKFGISSTEADGKSRPWFLSAETAVAVVAGGLSVWISLAADFSTSARLAAPFAVAVLAVGFVFLAE